MFFNRNGISAMAAKTKIDVFEESTTTLAEYARIPIAYEVSQILAVEADGHSGFALSKHSIDAPYMKDYDANKEEGPAQWARRFDMSNWTLFAAYREGRRVGGAAIAFKTADIDMLEGREDIAILWDIRVTPEARGNGVGSALFQAAEVWAKAKGCKQLKVETQNINVPACGFYEAQGCVIGSIRHFAYPEFPEEIQILWYKDLVRSV